MAAACTETDAGVTTAVKAKLAADDVVKASDVNVTTEDHVVTLTGEVETHAAKERAVRLTRETDGVRGVVDELVVGTGGQSESIGDKIEDGARATGDAIQKGAEATGEAVKDAGEAVRDAVTDEDRDSDKDGK
jgi:hypothetical protein